MITCKTDSIRIPLFNLVKVHLLVDNEIIASYGNDFAISLISKAKFRNKLRRLSYSTEAEGHPAILNATPGPIDFNSATEHYSSYEFELKSSGQDPTWVGLWSLWIAVGPYGNSTFTAEAFNYINFYIPSTGLTQKVEFTIYITLTDKGIILRRAFVLNESQLDLEDILI